MPKVNDEYPNQNEVSADELKKRAIAHYDSNKQQEKKFPTEIVELPSKGLIYPEGNPLTSGKIEMKYMTAREEDILTTQSLIKQGIVVDRLFQALIVGNGEGQKVNYGDLVAGDKNAIMIAARVLGYGKDYEISVDTPSGETIKETIDLTTIDNKPLDESYLTPYKNEFDFELPVSNRKITIKILSHRDEGLIEQDMKASKKLNKLRGVNNDVTVRLRHIITSIDGDESKKAIREFVENDLLAIDSKAIREFYRAIAPDIDIAITLEDPNTGDDFEVSLPIDLNFFWPGA